MAANHRPNQNLSGQRLASGRYLLEQLLATSELSNLYLATDTHLEANVTISVMHDHLAEDAHFAARFVQAARAAVLHYHPGLVRAFDYGAFDYGASDYGAISKSLFLIMELLPKPSLAEHLAQTQASGQQLALDEALYLVQQVGETMVFLHRHNLPMRRIEPSQIMLRNEVYSTQTGRFSYLPVLVDVPIASPQRAIEPYAVTLPFAYMAPEVILGQGIDGRAAVYMLGALAWELVQGQPMFQADNLIEAVDFHRKRASAPAHEVQPELPEPIAHLLEKALAESPHQRYPSLSAMLEDLAAMSLAMSQELPQEIHPLGMTMEQLRPDSPPQIPEAPRTDPPRADAAAISDAPPLLARPAEAQLVEQVAERVAEQVAEQMAAPAEVAAPNIAPVPTVAMQLQIDGPDASKRLVELAKPTMTIGRSLENDIVLDDPRISRKHASIESDGHAYFIVDLNSANGIILNEARIPPKARLPWQAGAPIRIGQYLLQLVSQQQDLPTRPNSLGSEPFTAHLDHLEHGEAAYPPLLQDRATAVAVLLEQDTHEVEPGQRLIIPFVVRNLQHVADLFTLSMTGVPDGWLSYPASMRLAPHAQEQVNLEVQPIRSPQTTATTYSLQITVTSQQDLQNVAAHGHLRLNVTLYDHLQIDLQPPTVNEGETIRVNIENQGNSTQQIKLIWWDDQRELVFQPEDAEVRVQPGEATFVEFSTNAQATGWLVSSKSFAVTVQAHSQIGHSQLCKGTIIRRGRIPSR